MAYPDMQKYPEEQRNAICYSLYKKKKMKKNFVCCDSAGGCYLPEDDARQVDALTKTLPKDCTFQKKAYPVEYQFEPGERSEVSIITSQTVDKSNEVVLVAGLNLDTYRNSYAVLYEHDRNKPFANCKWIKSFNNDTEVRAKTIYPTKPEGEDVVWLADSVWALTKCVPPVLRCKSIGFLPREPKRSPTREELALYPEWKGAGVWANTLLLEYSVVTNGCHQDAIVMAVNDKSIDPIVFKSAGIAIPQPEVKEVVKECACHSAALHAMHEKKLTLADAIDYVSKHCGTRKPVKKKINLDELYAKAINELSIDPDKIVAAALEKYKNRGRV